MNKYLDGNERLNESDLLAQYVKILEGLEIRHEGLDSDVAAKIAVSIQQNWLLSQRNSILEAYLEMFSDALIAGHSDTPNPLEDVAISLRKIAERTQ